MYYDTYKEVFRAWKKLYEKDPDLFKQATIEQDEVTGLYWINVPIYYEEITQ